MSVPWSCEDDLFVAGHVVPPGRYRRVEVPKSEDILLEHLDFLPASFDGHVAVYWQVQAFTEIVNLAASAASREANRVRVQLPG